MGEQPGTERTAENGIILEAYVVKEGKGKTGWRGVKFMACFQQCQHHCVEKQNKKKNKTIETQTCRCRGHKLVSVAL